MPPSAALTEFVALLFLLQDKEQILLPVPLQTARDFLFTGPHSPIPQRRQFPPLPLSCQNRLHNRLPRYPAQIADHIRQLQVHLRQRLVHPLNVPRCSSDQIVPLPPVRPHHADFLRRPERIPQ
jgi:hypothetical protein